MKSIILTEGGAKIGFGHITRCFALYQALEEKGNSIELILNADESVLDFIKGSNYQRVNWIAEQNKITDLIKDVDFVIIDSYLAEKPLYDKISEISGGNLLMIDDCKRLEYPRGIVVNPSIYGEKLNYPQKKGITYLLGKEYIILRKEFWKAPEKKINKEAKDVLITFGGMYNKSLMDKIVNSLKDSFKFDAHVLDSKSNKVNEKEMLELMLKADICISSGGQTTYELARVGVPTIGICFVKNQRMNLEEWEEAGFLAYAGWYKDESLIENIVDRFSSMLSYDKRSKMSIAGRNYVDGRGAERIANLLHAKVALKQ